MKTTLITGASGGIGEAFARRLAAEKHNLFLAARSEDKLQTLCDELKKKHQISANYIAVDLTEYNSDARVFEETERQNLEIDWLINNAGFGSMGDFANLELEKELTMIDLNVRSLVGLTHRYLQKMREKKSGVIINVASTASFQTVPYMATYAATKAFVRSFSEAISEENRLFDIKIIALCPGPTDTQFFDVANAEAFKAKGMQTSEAVVETALKAVKSGKATIISGWTNYIGAKVVNFIPTALMTKVVGSVLRSKVINKKQIQS